MSDHFNFAHEVTQRYGLIKRARGCYLHTSKGDRLVDMFQEYGRAILGWDGGKSRQVLKNVLDTGLTGSYESKYSHGLERALKRHMPDYSQFRFYSSMDHLCDAFCKYFDLWVRLPLCENPAVNKMMSADAELAESFSLDEWLFVHGVSIWRPWLIEAWYDMDKKPLPGFLQKNANTRHALAVVPPFPWTNDCYIAAFDDSYSERILPSDPVSPAILAAVTRSFHDLFDELPRRSELDWCKFDDVLLKYWQRRGPYLIPEVPPERYEDFYLHCLDNKIVVSPKYLVPSIIPYGANAGDFTMLKKNPFSFERENS